MLDAIYKEEIKLKPSLKRESLEVLKETKLPMIDAKIKSIKTIEVLRQSSLVCYAEPMVYDPLAGEEKAAALRTTGPLVLQV